MGKITKEVIEEAQSIISNQVRAPKVVRNGRTNNMKELTPELKSKALELLKNSGIQDDFSPCCYVETEFRNWDYYCTKCGKEYADGEGLLQTSQFLHWISVGIELAKQ